MSDEPVTLEFLARQLRGLRDDVHALNDQMTVLTAIVVRLEGSQNTLAEQVTAMVMQHQRFNNRLRALEEERR